MLISSLEHYPFLNYLVEFLFHLEIQDLNYLQAICSLLL